MFTKDTEYAVVVMRQLKTIDNPPIALKNIVEIHNLKQGFAEQVCRRLSKAGLIRAVKGPGGGYYLTRDGKEATLWDVMQVVEVSLSNKMSKILEINKDIFFDTTQKLKRVKIKPFDSD